MSAATAEEVEKSVAFPDDVEDLGETGAETSHPEDEVDDLEQQGAAAWDQQDGIVYYHWSNDNLTLAEKLSEEPQRFLCGAWERAPRSRGRTLVDNEIDMMAYLNNKENWYAAGSRLMLFSAALLGLAAFAMLFLSSEMAAEEEGLTLWQFICKSGSVSALYRTHGEPSAPNKLFESFMVAGAVLLLGSNFGYYILPRWENSTTLEGRRNLVGDLANETTKFCICRTNYKRVEATSNWVTAEEGIFKLTFNILTPTCVLLLATVPLPPPEDGNWYQEKVHGDLAIVSFVSFAICEL